MKIASPEPTSPQPEQAAFVQPEDVARALARLGQEFEPRTGSILFAGGQARRTESEPFGPGFLSWMENRGELIRRLRQLDQRDRLLLFLWYVQAWPPYRVAERLGISRVHCYRLRNRALRALAGSSNPDGDASRGAGHRSSTASTPNSSQSPPSRTRRDPSLHPEALSRRAPMHRNTSSPAPEIPAAANAPRTDR